MSIERKNNFGFTVWSIVDNETGAEIVTFDLYFDAVDFLLFINEE
jgi:hypothetical protein